PGASSLSKRKSSNEKPPPHLLPERAMSIHRLVNVTSIALALFGLSISGPGHAQDAKAKKKAEEKATKDSVKLAKAAKDSGKVSHFFQTEEPLTLTLTTNLRRIKGDKGDD